MNTRLSDADYAEMTERLEETMRTLGYIAPEVDWHGEYRRPSLFLWIGTTVVLVGCVFCALRALGVI